MTFKPHYPPGSTPLDPDELGGLIPADFITMQGELNIVEQANILQGKSWAMKFKKDLLDEAFSRALHKKMYEDVWKWAGKYRTSQKSIGIDAAQISTQVFTLMKDTQAWIEFESYSWPEIFARFHHRLVYIHPFANGNGRYSRLHTELLASRYQKESPTWGARTFSGDINQESDIRTRYIATLQEADQKRFETLIHFLYS